VHLETVVGPATLLFYFGCLGVEIFQRLLEGRQHGLNALPPFFEVGGGFLPARLPPLLRQLEELLRAPLQRRRRQRLEGVFELLPRGRYELLLLLEALLRCPYLNLGRRDLPVEVVSGLVDPGELLVQGAPALRFMFGAGSLGRETGLELRLRPRAVFSRTRGGHNPRDGATEQHRDDERSAEYHR